MPKTITYFSLYSFLKDKIIRGKCNDIEVNWLDLPNQIQYVIATKLTNIADYIRFGAVCHSWRSIYNEIRHCIPPQVPLILFRSLIKINHKDYFTHILYSLTEKKVYNVQLPVREYIYCSGSSYGWLVIVCENYKVCLVNPFSSVNDEIHLPPLTTLESSQQRSPIYFSLRKTVISASPTSNSSYVVMAIYQAMSSLWKLAFFKPGSNAWTSIGYTHAYSFQDVICYKDKFYAIDECGLIFSIDVSKSSHKMQIFPPEHELQFHRQKYLVVCSDQMFQVIRNVGIKSQTFTSGFTVLLFDQTETKWIEVNNIFGHVLFIGNVSSLSLLASDLPECKPNHIYFAVDSRTGLHNIDDDGALHMGVFNLENGNIEPHFPTESEMIKSTPIWIQPMLQ